MNMPKRCPKCKKTHITKFGTRISVKRGRFQRFQCTDCGTTFAEKPVKVPKPKTGG